MKMCEVDVMQVLREVSEESVMKGRRDLGRVRGSALLHTMVSSPSDIRINNRRSVGLNGVSKTRRSVKCGGQTTTQVNNDQAMLGSGSVESVMGSEMSRRRWQICRQVE